MIARINEWTSGIEGLSVINYDTLPSTAWKPEGTDSAVYWRLVDDSPAVWIPDTFQTIWRTSTIRCHIFSADHATADTVARDLITQLYTAKRLIKEGESPIMVNQKNTISTGADPLRAGQVTVEATYGIIVFTESDTNLQNIEIEIKGEESDQWLPITNQP